MSLENTTDSSAGDSQSPTPAAPPEAASNGHQNTETATVTESAESASATADVAPADVPSAVAAAASGGDDAPRGTIAEWTVTILLLLFLTTTLVQAYVIPTGSMEDTLLIGDHLLVDKLAFAPSGPLSKHLLPYTDVQRGDIIVFRYPVDIRQTFVKRAIGVSGDRIRIVNKEVWRNGVKLDEPYKYHKSDYIDPYRDNFPGEPNVMVDRGAINMLQEHVVNGEVVVPQGTVFAMGDNRDNSLDSRYWGFVPRENIIGKPLIIYWSYDAPTDQLQDPSIGFDHVVDVAKNFFSKTRWNRTFQLIHPYRGN
ncbi:MAG: signal peptidase I [Bryobacteraceae bacterium]